MSPIISEMTGPIAKERIALGNQFFTLDETGGDGPVAQCADCKRQIPFGRATPWAEIDDTMRSHREKFCLARIERGGESVR